MANFTFYVASCLLLLTSSWHTSTGLPVPTLSAEKCANCSTLFKRLLLKVSEVLQSDDLCFGVPSDNVAVNRRTETVQACAPNLAQNSGCVMKRNSSFSESECLMNIMKDLAHYDAALQSYTLRALKRTEDEVALLSPTLGVIQSLRKNCSLIPHGRSDSSEEDTTQMWTKGSFGNRVQMCKLMRGLHLRTITINRAMGYISSGDHRK